MSIYALLLGGCGKDSDAALLRELLDSKDERLANAQYGLLTGYALLKPKEGWAVLQSTLADEKKEFMARYSALRTLRFLHGAPPKENRPRIIQGLRAAMKHADMADLAVEDLRRAKMWDLTDEVLKLYGHKKLDAPITRRAVIRYALSCPPTKATKDFLTARRDDARELVEGATEILAAEKKASSTDSRN
jgi:hypothetical protein